MSTEQTITVDPFMFPDSDIISCSLLSTRSHILVVYNIFTREEGDVRITVLSLGSARWPWIDSNSPSPPSPL